jgi:hypothetical protein
VFGLGGHERGRDRDGVGAWVTPFEPHRRYGRIVLGLVRVIDMVIDPMGRGDRVHMHGQTVLMVRVLMTRIGVHVLERSRP